MVLGTLGRDDRGADREELDHVAAPAVGALVDIDADDALGLGLERLGLHPLHRELAGVVQRLGEVGQLDVVAGLANALAQRWWATW